MRNLDSKIHLPGFDRFKFQFHSFFAETFSTASVKIGRSGDVRCMIALPPKAEAHMQCNKVSADILVLG
jgi:hypothetical protein